MKRFFLILLSLFVFLPSFSQSVKDQLEQLNPIWEEKELLSVHSSPATYNELIQIHLQEVINHLESVPPPQLTPQDLQNRKKGIDILAFYLERKLFPKNDFVNHIQPVFIDTRGVHCAVGYIIKESGYPELAKTISINENLAFVEEIKTEGLNEWVAQSGFTLEELKWIQPGYPPEVDWFGLGEGINGKVNSIYYSADYQTIIAGGEFDYFNDHGHLKNVSIFQNNQWSPLGDNIEGIVNDLIYFQNELYACGNFTVGGVAHLNFAKWENGNWQAKGTIVGGEAIEMELFNNELWISGYFHLESQPGTAVNLIKWDGIELSPAPFALDSQTTSLLEADGALYVGGAFKYSNSLELNHILKYENQMIHSISEGLPETPSDLVWFRDELWVSGTFFDPLGHQELGLMRYHLSEWESPLVDYYGFLNPVSYDSIDIDFHTMHVKDSTLLVGGNFGYYPLMGIGGSNIVSIEKIQGTEYWNIEGMALGVNGIVRDISLIEGNHISVAGEFTQWFGSAYSGIVSTMFSYQSISGEKGESPFLYPSPFDKSLTIKTPKNGATITRIVMYNSQGVLIKELKGEEINTLKISTSEFSSGVYYCHFQGINGQMGVQKVIKY